MDYGELFFQLIKGAITVVELFFVVLITSIPLGMGITLCLKVKCKPLTWFFEAYIFFFRGTPLLLQIYIIWTGLPFLPVIGDLLTFNSRFAAVCVAFILNYAAYFAEIFRGGLLAVDKGQYEAAKVLGLSKVQTYIRIVFPQMFRVCLPSLTNETITLVKDTSLASSIGVFELLYRTQNVVNSSGQTTPYILCIVFYLLLTTIPALLAKRLEKKLNFE